MPALFEALFAAALLDAKRPIPQGITAPNAAVPTRRFAVHRNNVVAGLVKALQTRFPAVEKIVGEEFFAAMARAFVVEQRCGEQCLKRCGQCPSHAADECAASARIFCAAIAWARSVGQSGRLLSHSIKVGVGPVRAMRCA